MFGFRNTLLSCLHISLSKAQGYWNCLGFIFRKLPVVGEKGGGSYFVESLFKSMPLGVMFDCAIGHLLHVWIQGDTTGVWMCVRLFDLCLFVYFVICLLCSQTQNVQLDSSLGARSVTTSVQRPQCHVTMPDADALILILAWLRLRHQKKTQSFDPWRSLRTRRATTGLGWSSEIILYVGWMVHPWT